MARKRHTSIPRRVLGECLMFRYPPPAEDLAKERAKDLGELLNLPMVWVPTNE